MVYSVNYKIESGKIAVIWSELRNLTLFKVSNNTFEDCSYALETIDLFIKRVRS